jgi:hypothetical protein
MESVVHTAPAKPDPVLLTMRNALSTWNGRIVQHHNTFQLTSIFAVVMGSITAILGCFMKMSSEKSLDISEAVLLTGTICAFSGLSGLVGFHEGRKHAQESPFLL